MLITTLVIRIGNLKILGQSIFRSLPKWIIKQAILSCTQHLWLVLFVKEAINYCSRLLSVWIFNNSSFIQFWLLLLIDFQLSCTKFCIIFYWIVVVHFQSTCWYWYLRFLKVIIQLIRFENFFGSFRRICLVIFLKCGKLDTNFIKPLSSIVCRYTLSICLC